jgi:mannose-6-phosphate isomerase
MNDYSLPWRLVPSKLHEYPGGREIDRFRGIVPAQDNNKPEAWIGSVTFRRHAADPLEGLSFCVRPSGGLCRLYDAIRENPQAMLGSATSLDILVKLLDAKEQLVFQCHPSREAAQRFFGSIYGKTEAWIIIGLREDARVPPYVLLGFREGISREKFQALYLAGDIAGIDSLAHKIPVSVGDVYFVGPGVPHAIGPGCFLVEVQEPSDITIGRDRLLQGTKDMARLHDECVLGCYDFTGHTYGDNLLRCRIAPRTLRRGLWGSEELLIGRNQTPYFSCARLCAVGPVVLTDTGRATVCLVLSGSGEIACGSFIMKVNKADELFLPASALVTVYPSSAGIEMILCYPEGALEVGMDEQ